MTDKTHPIERYRETGQWDHAYSLDEFRAALDSTARATTRDVEEAVGSSYATALRRLNELAERGEAESRRAGNAHLWSLTPQGEQALGEGNDQ